MEDEIRPKSKSVSFDPEPSVPSSDDGNSNDSSDHKNKNELSGDIHKPIPEPLRHSVHNRATSKPSIGTSRKSKSKSRRRSVSPSWFQRTFGCCGDGRDSDSDEHDDIDDRIHTAGGTAIEENEIIRRLQQAVNEFGHPPTTYEIESEIIKWQRMLDIEQKLYEESGQPKFKYKLFRKNRYLQVRKHPLYGTNYENHRKLETRLKEFRFGAGATSHKHAMYDDDVQKHDSPYLTSGLYDDDSAQDNSAFWRNDKDTFRATLSLIYSANNFFRFPHVCYSNGGFTFLLTYCLMVAAVGQPLLYFEMLLGQYSLNGPMGFSTLHPYAKGIPYAAAFVCVVFGTAKSVFVAYSLLYSFLGVIASPGNCGWWWNKKTKCLPYNELESPAIIAEAAKSQKLFLDNNKAMSANLSVFSVELYFREFLQNSDWLTKDHFDILHWKLTLAFLLISMLAYMPIHYNLTGRAMKKYLRYSLILPIMTSLLLLHQVFSRGAIKQAISYFIKIDTEHVSALSIWSEAFEMVLDTLGIGYGFHWAISGRTRFDYRRTYKTSWRICGYSVLMGLISSLVIFLEVGIIGQKTGHPSPYHIFFDRLGISFVAFSGALMKFGGNTSIFVVIYFLLFAIYGMWSQIIIADIILQWFENSYIMKGRSRYLKQRKVSSIIFVIGVQVAVISPYLSKQGSSVLASENVFGGSLAAYSVVLAELIVAAYLYGFAQFSADLEIMTKRPLPTLFQIQIRYIVIPTIMIFMIPMIVNVYVYPHIYKERNSLGWLFYFGLLANFTPILIIGLTAQWKYLYGIAVRKVHPDPFLFERPISHSMTTGRRSVFESRFVGKVKAPSQTNSFPIRSELYQVTEHNMTYIYEAQQVIQNQFRTLLKFKHAQAKWLYCFLVVMLRQKLKSIPKLIRCIMLYMKYNDNRVDIRFIRRTLNQIVNLTFYSAVRKLQRMPLNELIPYLADEFIMLTTFHTEEYHYHHGELVHSSTDDSSEDEDDENNNNDIDDDDDVEDDSSSSDEVPSEDGRKSIDFGKIHRRVFGKVEKSPQELRTLLTIRLKRGMNLPYEGELSVLKFLRRERAQKERKNSCWSRSDPIPIDHFIPASINKGKDKVCYTIFHAVVIDGVDHFALKRLPVPKPPIVRVTKAFVESQPGKTLTDKFSVLVKTRMLRNAKQIVTKRNLKTWPKYKIRRHLWKVSDHIDDDVYDFLDRILTCVIVVVDGRGGKGQAETLAKPLYLTPRTRRKISEARIFQHLRDGHIMDEGHGHGQLEITTYSEVAFKQMRMNKWIKLLEAPPDIVYHPFDSESSDEIENDEGEVLDVKSSSGSGSSLSPDSDDEPVQEKEKRPTADFPVATGFYTASPFNKKSRYILTNEKIQHRDRRDSYKNRISVEEEDEKIHIATGKVRHISARRWHRRKLEPEAGQKFGFGDKELKLHEAIDAEAWRRGLLTLHPRKSKSMEDMHKKEKGNVRRTLSFQSLRHFLESAPDFVDIQTENWRSTTRQISHRESDILLDEEDVLANNSTAMTYITIGKTMIVDRAKGVNIRERSSQRFHKSFPSKSTPTSSLQ